MKCASCGERLPSGKKESVRYCGDACRGEAAKNRRKLQNKKAQQLAEKAAAEVGTKDGAEAPTSRTPGPSSRRASHRVLHNRQALGRESTERITTATQQRGQPDRNPLITTLRIDMKEQILRQAPQEATGYGLVLPAAQDGVTPKLIPRWKKGEVRAPYRLTPFDYPLDIRLRDGSWYRILWYGKDGQQVPPPPDTGVPSLYFFLGSPEQAPRREVAMRQEPPVLCDGATDADNPKRLAAPEAISDAKEATASLQAKPVESAQQSSPEQSPTPASMNDPKDSPHPIPASNTPPQQPHRFWSAEGKCLLHVESLAQLLFEQRAALAKEQGQKEPPEPLTRLSSDERQKIHRMAKHPVMAQLGRAFIDHLASVQTDGIGLFESLPLNIESRSPPEQQLLREAQKHPDKREYLDYLYRRARTLLAGEPNPIEPQTALSAEEKQRLTKLVFDLRALPSMVKISDGGSKA